ncbi:L-ascorbate oxidase-like protein [Drosera capensis]
MRADLFLCCLLAIFAFWSFISVDAEDPYRLFEWTVSYGTIAPLGVPQRGILINGKFPGPILDCVTNDNVFVMIINKLDEPFLITWNGVQQRKSSWQDGVLGTNCAIPPNSYWTYKMQVKDQIGTYSYFPSTLMHRAAGGFGAFTINRRSVITIPYPEPDGEYTVIVGDWFNTDYKVLQQTLDSGKPFPFPDGLLINGHQNSSVFTGEVGKTYLFRVSNVGLTASINFRIQNHVLTLVEVEGSHTRQVEYESLDIHVGQSMAFLVTLNETAKDYFCVASTRFTKPILVSTAILHYNGSLIPASGPLPSEFDRLLYFLCLRFLSYRWNLTANAARPNPQGSYHYGTINVTRTFIFENSATSIDGKLRYAVNNVSYVNPATPLKLADYYNISGVFNLSTIPDNPMPQPARLGTSVIGTTLHDFIEIIFQNNENTIQSWHLDGYAFWTVAFGYGQWNPGMRKRYNKVDAPARYTVQVYPKSWSAILVSLDNKGIWNLRSAIWPRQYLGQQLYIRVWNDEQSLYTEHDIPTNVLKCGKAVNS